MKKSYLIAAAALAIAGTAGAQTVGNPKTGIKDENGKDYYFVAYDMEKDEFIKELPEIDQTFVFAIDFTGTGLEDKMKTLPEPNRANVQGRSGAFDMFNLFNLSDVEGATAKADGRLFPINRDKNIYGMVVNMYQLITSRMNDMAFGPNADYSSYKVLEKGCQVAFGDNVFAFGWSTDNPGAEWWDAIGAPVQDVLQWQMAPYTGEKTGEEWNWGTLHPDTEPCPLEGLDPGAYYSMCSAWGGYDVPASYKDHAAMAPGEGFVPEAGGVNSASIDKSQVVATEYFDLAGRRMDAPAENGVTIVRNIMANGAAKAVKVIR